MAKQDNKKAMNVSPGAGSVNIELLQEIQSRFCLDHHLYCICFNHKKEILLQSYASESEWNFLYQYVGKAQVEACLDKTDEVSDDCIEEILLRHPFLRLCKMNVKPEGDVINTWMVCGIISEKVPKDLILPSYIKQTTEEDFEQSLAFLHKLSKQYFMVRLGGMSVHDKTETTGITERNQVMTDIVNMMNTEEDFTYIAEKMIEDVCGYLNVESGCLIQLNSNMPTADMICEWVSDNDNSYIEKCQRMPRLELPFMDGHTHIVTSETFVTEGFHSFLKKYNINAGVFLPIKVSDEVLMYLCFTEGDRNRIWTDSEVHVFEDVRNSIQSIVARRITKEFLTGANSSLEAILENVGCGILVQDLDKGKILFTNKQLRKIFNPYTKEKIRNLTEEWEHRGRKKNWHSEIYVSGDDKWFDLRFVEISWIDGRKVQLCTTHNITETKLYQQKMEKQANNDFLTGLYNRMRCEQDLAEYILETKRVNGQGALLYIDLDDFKYINDGLGHQYGDVLLKAISHSLQRIEGIENTCYRMGGDEFIVIITYEHFNNLAYIINKINKIFSQPWFLKGADYYCTMSMGIARFPKDGDTVHELIKKSDIALFEAKKRGKNRYEFYDDTVEISSFKRLDLEKNMRNATKNACEEFEVYFQPIIDITKPGSPCTGAEALIRWNSESLGFVSPADFIPLAEYLGLINPIGNHILLKACRECKKWNEHGHPEYKVNVNLSVVQLLQNDITDTIRKILDDTGIAPQNLTLEVTESLAINDMARMKWILNDIKSLGVRVALDDFGTGYSSLNHIREMPIDVIKIDRCFILDLGRDDYAELFVKMVAELAGTIGMKMCIEGVETKEQLDILKKMKIKMIQGYYFDKPLSSKDFEKKYVTF